MIRTILNIISGVLSLYSMLCLIDIILSWFPRAKYSSFGRFISSICDPYLGIFSNIRWLQFGNIDFSPIVSLGLLSLVSTILGRIINTGVLHIGGILGTIIYSVWSIASSLISILFLLILIRWIALLANHGQTSSTSIWYQVDNFLHNIAFKIGRTFYKKTEFLDYKKALLISWIVLLILLSVGQILISILVNLFNAIPI
ncbi:MAG: YggT family protein [Treponema sp.]|nr:YggT family protein [Treponema sp.]